MRNARILGRNKKNYYHLMSRVVSGDFLLGQEEKDFFLFTMRRLEAFMGVKILTYCIMTNHFHILAEVPEITSITDAELLRKIEGLYGKIYADEERFEYKRLKKEALKTGDDWELKRWREPYLRRMGNLSVFGQELKSRFARWYNWRKNREGAFWSSRFKSVLVENSESALSMISAYIDLNPVRAGIVKDPKAYRFSGYGEAMAGGRIAKDGICAWSQMVRRDVETPSWSVAATMYRVHLFGVGEGSGIDSKRVKEVLEAGGKLSTHELLRCRVRYFVDGLAIGSKSFVEEVFDTHRGLFAEKRDSGARKIKKAEDSFFCLRDLRKEPIRAPS